MKIKKQIFKKIDYKTPFTFSTIKEIVKDDDIIFSGYDEGFYSENNSIEGHFYIKVERMVEETDDEKSKRLSENEKHLADLKEKRYQSYLKLKKEFEDEK